MAGPTLTTFQNKQQVSFPDHFVSDACFAAKGTLRIVYFIQPPNPHVSSNSSDLCLQMFVVKCSSGIGLVLD